MKIKAISDIIFLFFLFMYMTSDYYIKDAYYNNYLSCAFYFVLGIYLSLNKLIDINYAVLKQYKLVFKGTGVFFLFFWLTEGILFFDVGKYEQFVIYTNIFTSGALVIFLIFICMTFKNVKNDINNEK